MSPILTGPSELEAWALFELAAEKQKGFGHFHHTAYTIEWLRQAAADGFPCYPLFERDRSLDPVRKDPQFQELLARLKQQWESYKASL